jgi:hypothetical protein
LETRKDQLLIRLIHFFSEISLVLLRMMMMMCYCCSDHSNRKIGSV